MNKYLTSKYEEDKSVESMRWWIEAGKEITKKSLRAANKTTPDDHDLNKTEKSLTLFARNLLATADLSQVAHQRVSWMSDDTSTSDIKDCLLTADIAVKVMKSWGCCGAPAKSPNASEPH